MPDLAGLPTPPLGGNLIKQGDDYLRALDAWIRTNGITFDEGPIAERPVIDSMNPGNGRRVFRDANTNQVYLDIISSWTVLIAGDPEPARLVGAAGQPVLTGGWVNSPSQPLRFWKDQIGRVHLGGFTYRTSGTARSVFVLPVGYRPVVAQTFSVSLDKQASIESALRLNILTNGSIEVPSGLDPALNGPALDGLSFDPRR